MLDSRRYLVPPSPTDLCKTERYAECIESAEEFRRDVIKTPLFMNYDGFSKPGTQLVTMNHSRYLNTVDAVEKCGH